MFWIQEEEFAWKLYVSPSKEQNYDAAGSVEFENDTQMWLGLDYTRPDDSKAGCATFGPFLTEDEAEDAVEKSVDLSTPAAAQRRAASTS